MIEAIEIHETKITKTVSVKLENPLIVGIWLGIGFIAAPILIGIAVFIVITILSLISL